MAEVPPGGTATSLRSRDTVPCTQLLAWNSESGVAGQRPAGTTPPAAAPHTTRQAGRVLGLGSFCRRVTGPWWLAASLDRS